MNLARRGIRLPVSLFAALAFAFASTVAAGDAGYRIESSSIDAGTPVASDGNGYRLRGSVGQPDAGVLAGSGYLLRGGFWPGASLAPNDIIFADGFETSSATHPRGELP
jgi:hypothetical protein